MTFNETPGQPTQESHPGKEADNTFTRYRRVTAVFVSLNLFSPRPGEDNLVYGKLTALVRHLSVPSLAVPPQEFPV